MSKYDPLKEHLQQQGREFVPMTFSEIERILGFSMPAKSKSNRAWWSNNSSNSVMTKVWRKAGYRSESVDIENEKVVFHRDESIGSNPEVEGRPAPDTKKPRRHPLFGCLAGSIHVPDSTDLTAPADPDWGKNL